MRRHFDRYLLALALIALLAGLGSGVASAASPEVVLSETFDSGAKGWTMTGLWGPSTEGTRQFMRYANANGDYNTGSRTQGSLVSPPFALRGTGNVLTFSTREEVEQSTDLGNIGSAPGRDLRLVEISTDGGLTWHLVASSQMPDQVGSFTPVRLGLDAFGPSEQARLRFHFDSVDANDNSHYGWGVDDVKVERTTVPIDLTPLGWSPPALGALLVAPGASPQLFAAIDASGRLQVGTVTDDRTVVTPTVLSAPVRLTGQPAYIGTRTRGEYLFAAATDGKIYRTARASARSGFPALQALQGVSGATGRLAADLFSLNPPAGGGPVERLALLWVGNDGHVYLAHVDPDAVGAALTPTDLTQELSLAAAGQAELALSGAYLAIPAGGGVAVAQRVAGPARLIAQLDAPLGASIVAYGGLVHVVYASASGEPRQLFLGPSITSDGPIALSVPGAEAVKVTSRPQLMVHRGQLFASWLEGASPRVVRFDGDDGEVSRRWISEYSGRGVVASAPALATDPSGLVVYVSTSRGRAARLLEVASWEDLGALHFGAEVLHTIDAPGAVTLPGSANGIYALDDGRLARVRPGGSFTLLAAAGTLYGAESGPSAVRSGSTSTVAVYEAGNEVVQSVLADVSAVPQTSRLPLPTGIWACSPPSALATGSSYRVFFAAADHGTAPVGARCANPANGFPIGMFVIDGRGTTYHSLGALPGGRGAISPPVAVRDAAGVVLVFVLGDDGKIYFRDADRAESFRRLSTPATVPALINRLAVTRAGRGVALAALGRDRRLYLGVVKSGQLAELRISPLALRFQYGPALIGLGGTRYAFATSLDGRLYEGVATTGDYHFSDRGFPPTSDAPRNDFPLALVSAGGHLLGLSPGGGGVSVVDVRASGLHERLAAIGFEMLWHPNHYYPQPETSLDQTEWWNEAAHLTDRLPEPLALQFLRDVATLQPFDHARSLISPVLQVVPAIGARPYRNIVFGSDPPEGVARQWEEFGHNMTVEVGIEASARVLNPALAADVAGISEMRSIFKADLSCASGVPGPAGLAADGKRYRGFVSYSGNYQCNSNGHSFIYALAEYYENGPLFRSEAAEDKAAGFDLLQRKYEWIDLHIYHGRQFTSHSEPCLGPPNTCQ